MVFTMKFITAYAQFATQYIVVHISRRNSLLIERKKKYIKKYFLQRISSLNRHN